MRIKIFLLFLCELFAQIAVLMNCNCLSDWIFSNSISDFGMFSALPIIVCARKLPEISNNNKTKQSALGEKKMLTKERNVI